METMKGNKSRHYYGLYRNFCGGITLICLTAGSLYLSGCASERGYRSEPYSRSERAGIEERWGVKVEGIRLASAGYMLDFRYRVTDPEKALPLFDRKAVTYLVDQDTGAKFVVPAPPKVGPLRQTVRNGPPHADKTYFVFFANPGKYVKAGKKVTVVIGDFKAEDIEVR